MNLRRRPGPGKDSPMPCLLNLIYATLLAACSPLLLYRSLRTGRVPRGLGREVPGPGPAPDRRPALRLVPRRQRGRGPAPQADPPGAGPAAAGLGGGDLDDHDRTGLAMARRNYPDLVTFYAPLDFSWSARRAVARIRPTVLALVELELWPNLVRAAKEAGARVAIVNGRLSHRSHRGYRKLRGPLGPTLRRLDAVAAQNDEYADRFVDLGVPRGRVRVTGSVKFDGLETRPVQPEDAGPPQGARAGPRPSWSSWPGARWRGRRRRRWRPIGRPGPAIPSSAWCSSPATPSGSTGSPSWLEGQGERVVRRSEAGDRPPPAPGARPRR